MADVQLEHGHVRIANRIVEAILDADFSGAQVRILLALARLTFGWRKKTVSIGLGEIATMASLSPTGGFRRAFRELVEHGVVIEIHEGRALTYAIQKDYTTWGKFGGNEGRLAALWDRRPASDDALLKHAIVTGQLTLQGAASEGDDPTGSPSVTPQGRDTSPSGVTGDGPKSLFGETVAGRKDRKDTERQLDDEKRREDVDESVTGVAVAVWANRAIAERWGEQPNPLTAGSAIALATRLVEQGVAADVVRRSLYRQCRSSQAEFPPKGVNYFEAGIVEDFERETMRAKIALDTSGAPPRESSLHGGRQSSLVEAQRIVSQIRQMVEHNGTTRIIVRSRVAALGAEIDRAYAAIGGAERFTSQDSRALEFLAHDFARALEAERGAAVA